MGKPLYLSCLNFFIIKGHTGLFKKKSLYKKRNYAMSGVKRKMKPWDTPTSVTTVMVDSRTQDQIRKEIRARIY